MKRLLLCTDGSEQALHATRLAADLACRLAASVCLVNVEDLMVAYGPYAFAPESAPPSETTLEYLRQAQKEILQNAAQVLAQANVPYQLHAELGNPIEQIVTLVEQEKADLIIIGSRGLSGWKALLLGSVSQGVVHHAPCPVLVVRGEPQGFRQIVVASDGSGGAVHALRAGAELARSYQAPITVVNVFEPLSKHPGISAENLDPEVYAARIREAVDQQIQPIAREWNVPYTLCQETGHPVETLVHFAEDQQADLIVLGSRGLGGFKRLLLGSVSDGVLHHAHCSVLITS
jgi:nucleotide-binding universal stress UspA family protein